MADSEVRKQSYLIGHRRERLGQGLEPLNLQLIANDLPQIADVDVKEVLDPPPGLRELGLLSAVPAQSGGIIVAEMPPEKAMRLQQQPALVVEPNVTLQLPQVLPAPEPPTRSPSVLWPAGTGFNVVVQVTDGGGAPLAGAEVYIFGSKQNTGVTGNNGQAQLLLVGESPGLITGLYVKPKSDYWERWVPQPALVPNQTYTVSLRPLTETFPNFPAQERRGWGLAAMKIDQLDATQFSGQGIKVATIDSGAAAVTHQDLQGQVQAGLDIINNNDNQSWSTDTVGHGTHVAGVIAGRADAHGILGIAPKAKLFIYRIFPGGQFNELIKGLDKCIADGVDVVNLSLGANVTSQFVEERLVAARNAGIVCIVAAGNSAGPVQYPASSAQVMAVAAIGKTGEFPSDTFHATQQFAPPDASGYFPAKFSCFGPQIGVGAPGVAVLSSVPDNGYAAWDGTSMAGPHVAGLAALILAHHPDFQRAPYNQRNSQRVDRVFRILKETAQSLSFGQQRIGAGLPDAVKAMSATLGPETNAVQQNGVSSAGADSFLERARLAGILG